MSKLRQFSIVLHNVRHDSKSSAEDFVKSLQPVQYTIALESYPDQEGFHLHIFIKFSSSRSFKKMLTLCQNFSKSIVAPRPEGEERSWGRVQVDQMRGTFEQAKTYLTNPSKDKPLDPDVTNSAPLDPFYKQFTDFANEQLRLFYGSWHFPDIGMKVQGFQYVELLRSRGIEPRKVWVDNYNFVKSIKV